MNSVLYRLKRDSPEVDVIEDGVTSVGWLHLLYIRLIGWRKVILRFGSGLNLHREQNLCRVGSTEQHGGVHHAHGLRLSIVRARSTRVICEVSSAVGEIHIGLFQLHAHAAVTTIPFEISGGVGKRVIVGAVIDGLLQR